MTHAAIHDDLKSLAQESGAIGLDALENLAKASSSASNSRSPLYEVASFFPTYQRREPLDSRVDVQVCGDAACLLAGLTKSWSDCGRGCPWSWRSAAEFRAWRCAIVLRWFGGVSEWWQC